MVLGKTATYLVIVLIAVTVASLHGATTEPPHLNVAGRDVAIWKPVGPTPVTGYPLIVFSHGLTGCNTQSVFLMEALARAGYFVIAPNHNDATCGSAKDRSFRDRMRNIHPQQPLREPSKWSPDTYRDRYEDIEVVLNEVLRNKQFAGVPIDANRIGIAGHSLGGYTALGVSGGWSSWKDPRVKAVLALSPHCSPFVDHGDLNLGIPVMFQGGTADFGETPIVRRPGGAYDRSSAPKYYIELDGAGHFAWTDLNPKYQQAIDEYSVAFFDRYLKGVGPNPLTPLMQTPLPKGVSAVRFKID